MVDFMHISNLLDALVVLDLLHGDLKTPVDKWSCHWCRGVACWCHRLRGGCHFLEALLQKDCANSVWWTIRAVSRRDVFDAEMEEGRALVGDGN